ncbi:flagellar basal body-associated FliL family protein [Pseudoruegeria sp. HB172150]|uniref:flagellar basal body-associated FliL family protein n=1 Tax=Pseudoruegeria sp. HB172150 TaxID=2721164 RepID=UPI0015549C13|nr:flagellar basal body-associated FliL family protein [Pseudoruegeria sp. HB172150]
MLGKLIPLLLALIGLGAGVGAGIALRPTHDEMALEDPCGDMSGHDGEETQVTDGHEDEDVEEEASSHDYVKLNNQFIVPVVSDGRVNSLVVMSLTIEVPLGQTEAIYEREPKLRDALLQVMFDHANAGGFDGAFTNGSQLNVLRNALREAAQKTVGPLVSDVLILDIVRQDN